MITQSINNLVKGFTEACRKFIEVTAKLLNITWRGPEKMLINKLAWPKYSLHLEFRVVLMRRHYVEHS